MPRALIIVFAVSPLPRSEGGYVDLVRSRCSMDRPASNWSRLASSKGLPCTVSYSKPADVPDHRETWFLIGNRPHWFMMTATRARSLSFHERSADRAGRGDDPPPVAKRSARPCRWKTRPVGRAVTKIGPRPAEAVLRPYHGRPGGPLTTSIAFQGRAD